MAKSSDPIYEQLKKEIEMLVIEPTTMLREVDVAERFNVSRTPVRDVFVRLERDGLLEVVSQKGTYVTKIDIDNISEIMYIRKTIEADVLSTLIEKITPDQINILKIILMRQKEILSLPSSIEKNNMFYENDNKFHASMFNFVGKLGVWNELNNLSPTYNRYRNVTYLRKIDRLEQLYEFHVQILKAIEEKDKNKALSILNEHFYSGLSGIEDVYLSHRHFFL